LSFDFRDPACEVVPGKEPDADDQSEAEKKRGSDWPAELLTLQHTGILSRDHGVLHDFSLENAGLIIVSVDDVATGSPADLIFSLYGHEPGDRIKIGVIGGTEFQTLEVLIVERPHDIDQLVALADSDHNLVRRLGILATEIDVTVASLFPSMRLSGGVIVIGRADSWRASDVSLGTGDVIHAVKDHPVVNLTDRRAALDAVGSGGSVVLPIERSGRLMFVAFQLD